MNVGKRDTTLNWGGGWSALREDYVSLRIIPHSVSEVDQSGVPCGLSENGHHVCTITSHVLFEWLTHNERQRFNIANN